MITDWEARIFIRKNTVLVMVANQGSRWAWSKSIVDDVQHSDTISDFTISHIAKKEVMEAGKYSIGYRKFPGIRGIPWEQCLCIKMGTVTKLAYSLIEPEEKIKE